METLESSRVCRLCGKKSGISINIFDRNESHVKKINAILPIMVHEMDLLPKHMCHRCSYKLEEFHKFYLDCLKTDTDLKSQLSWMRRDEEEVSSERIGVPMVYIENVKIKVEPGEYGTAYELEPMVNDVGYLNPMSFPVNGVRQPHHPDEIAYAAYTRCKYCCDRKDQSKRTVSSSYATMPSCGPDERTRRNVTKIDTVRHSFSSQGFRDSCTRPGTATTKSLVPSTTQLEDVHRNLEDSKDALKVMNVRNLRPRRKSVDYVGRKRNSPRKPRAIKLEQQQAAECTTVDIAKVKVEKPSDFEGRILRPRKTIDYIGPKRKYAKKNPVVTVQSDNRERKRQIKEESPGKRFKDKVKLEIKEELVDGFEDSLFGVQAEPGKPNVPLSQNTFTLPTRLGDVKNGSLAFAEPNYHSSSKKKLGSICGNGRIGETRYSANCIRREPAYPRKEKVRKLELRRNPSRRPGRPLGGKTGKVSLRSFPDTVSSNVRTVPGLNGRLLEGIKRYCEKCNISFANAELYRLHACYD